MVQFAHLSDTHLGYRQYNLEEREEDFYESFHEAIDKIIQERVDFVIHSGDLFEHKRPKVKALIEAQKGFSKLKDKEIPIYCIAGNHDLVIRKGAIPPQRLFSNLGVRILGGKEKYIENKTENLFIGGLSYYPSFYASQLKNELEVISEKANGFEKRIMILHQGLDSYLPYEGAYEIRMSELPKNFQYYAMGHVHKRITEKYGDGFLSFSGSTDIWRKDEINDYKKKSKGFNVVSINNDDISIERINLETTRHFDVESMNTKDFEDKIIQLQDELISKAKIKSKLPIQSFKIQGKLKFDSTYYSNQIRQAIEQYVLYYRIDLVPEEVEKEISVEETINLHQILNEIYRNNKDYVDFTYSLFVQLQDRNIPGALEVAQEFYKERWTDDN